MQRLILPILAGFLLAGCAASPSRELEAIGKDYLANRFTADPSAGTSTGLHQYDGKVGRFDPKSLERHREDSAHLLARIDRLLQANPDTETSLRARALRCAVAGEMFSDEVFRPFAANPMTLAAGQDVNIYAKREFASKQERLKSAIAVLQQVPRVMEEAKQNLEPKLSKVFIRTAIDISNGQAEFLNGDLLVAFDDVKDAKLQSELRSAAKSAADAVVGYANLLEKDRLPQATDRFAIGRDAFARMLSEMELIHQSPEEILSVGMAELKRQQEAFAAAAREVDSSKSPIEIWEQVQHEHPTSQTLISDTQQHLEEIRQFMLDRDLIRYPIDRRVMVEETPKYARATSFASMDTPGVFERRATESYYYVTPTEPEWDAKKVEEWLTAFNYYTTDVVSVHEAYPGHFVQALHLQASTMPEVQKAIGSYAFIEGWAHYTEQMALDEGFPPKSLQRDDKSAAKYRMAHASEALLRCCRLVAAIKMHCQGMSLDEATQFFMDNCYYEKAPATAEAERGSYDPGYCLYTVGKLQFLKLREDWKKQEGDQFSLKRFHDEVLRYGQPPVRLLRERMLKDQALWDKTL